MRKGRSKGRRMRGGGFMGLFNSDAAVNNPVAKTQEQIDAENNPVANNSNEAVANNSNEAVNNPVAKTQEQIDAENNPESSSLSNFIPSVVTDVYTSAKKDLGNFTSQTKEESNELLNNAKNFTSGITFSNPFSSESAPAQTPEPIGGYKRSKQMRMKGGKGLGLDYYATSVNGIKVAQPTYMEYYKGGKRRKTCKKRRTRRNRSRRRSCKKRSRRSYRRR
jgi:hypothetical protein